AQYLEPLRFTELFFPLIQHLLHLGYQVDQFSQHGIYFFPVSEQELAATGVHDLTLTVNDIVIRQYLLAGIEMETLDAGLGRLQLPGEHAVFDWLVFWDSESAHESLDTIAAEHSHQIILHRYIKLGLA